MKIRQENVINKLNFMYNSETIFSKIIKREISADIILEDENCLAFRDINPQAPVHILVIPKKQIAKLSESHEQDSVLLGQLLYFAKKVADKENLNDYRLVINNGEKAGQTVFHIHLHILGGRPFDWPPG